MHGLNNLNHIGRVGINDYSSCLTVSQARLGVLLERFFQTGGRARYYSMHLVILTLSVAYDTVPPAEILNISVAHR